MLVKVAILFCKRSYSFPLIVLLASGLLKTSFNYQLYPFPWAEIP